VSNITVIHVERVPSRYPDLAVWSLLTPVDPDGRATTGVRFTFSGESYSRRADCDLPAMLMTPRPAV
jgi:hypothetical protein